MWVDTIGAFWFELQSNASGSVECLAMTVQVCAHITGTVWKIQVAVGDTVEAEQSLVILESMKMEMPVEAPEPGRVQRIAVTEGQAVEEGEVLIELA
jgi:acetyl-CoA carboxylase biotin carboxyl carrier protein